MGVRDESNTPLRTSPNPPYSGLLSVSIFIYKFVYLVMNLCILARVYIWCSWDFFLSLKKCLTLGCENGDDQNLCRVRIAYDIFFVEFSSSSTSFPCYREHLGHKYERELSVDIFIKILTATVWFNFFNTEKPEENFLRSVWISVMLEYFLINVIVTV